MSEQGMSRIHDREVTEFKRSTIFVIALVLAIVVVIVAVGVAVR